MNRQNFSKATGVQVYLFVIPYLFLTLFVQVTLWISCSWHSEKKNYREG